MARLTERDEHGNTFTYTPIKFCGDCYIGEAIDKLADYEDAEEQCIKETAYGFKELLHKWKVFLEDMHELVEYRRLEEQGLLLRLEHPNGWIPCEERLPDAETEVLILAKRKYRDGTFRYIVTNAMYEDGTVSEYDSAWSWEDIDGEYDEENDCIIIPKGWWENKHYNPDGALNYAVDDEVIAWQPLPPKYEPKGE